MASCNGNIDKIPGGFNGDRDKTKGVLLFVHGLGESSLCFQHLRDRPELSGWTLLMPDIPGYGQTPCGADSPLSLGEQAQWLIRLLVDRGLGPVQVLGHSMGAVVALLMAEARPDLVKGIVDIDGNKSLADCVFSGRAVRWDSAEFAAGGFDQLREVVRRLGLRDRAQNGYHRSMLLADAATFHLNSRELVEMSAAEDMARRLADLTMPVLYIAGAPGGASSRSHELLAAAAVPTVSIEPAGHWPFIDQPGEFCRVVATWLGA